MPGSEHTVWVMPQNDTFFYFVHSTTWLGFHFHAKCSLFLFNKKVSLPFSFFVFMPLTWRVGKVLLYSHVNRSLTWLFSSAEGGMGGVAILSRRNFWQCLDISDFTTSERCDWHLVGRGQGCCCASYDARDSPTTKKNYLAQNDYHAEKE